MLTGFPGRPMPGGPGCPGKPGSPARPSGPTFPVLPFEISQSGFYMLQREMQSVKSIFTCQNR